MSGRFDRVLEGALRVPTTLRWLTVLAWAGIIFLASNQPGLAVSDDPGVDRPLRRVAHIVVYAVLATLLTWSLSGRRPPTARRAAIGGLLALLYGITDEWHQTMVPTRAGRPEDLIWDGLGALLAIGAIVVVGSAVARYRTSRA